MEKVFQDLKRIEEKHNLNTASVIILCHNGNAPYKISAPVPASQASAAALEILLAFNQRQFAFSTLPGIPAPYLVKSTNSQPYPTIATLDKEPQQLLPWCNIDQMAHIQLQADMPFIVARGVARLILRRCAVAAATKQDETIGALTDLTFLIVNATTQADTRAWDTLPSTIDLARFNVQPGLYPLHIQISSTSTENHTRWLNLKPGDLCVINLFNIHPHITLIHIPKQFLSGDNP